MSTFHETFKRITPVLPPMETINGVTIRTSATILDRRAGSTTVEEVYGPTLNLEAIAHAMSDASIRQAVSAFFLTGKMRKVLPEVISTNTVKKGEAVGLRDKLIAEINGAESNANVAFVVSQFACALAYKAGIINERTPLTRTITYPRSSVTPAKLTLDLVAQAAFHTAESINVQFDDTSKMSRESFAMAFAEALMPVGYELHRSVAIQHVFDDIIKAIRQRVCMQVGAEYIGTVDDAWLDHPVVAELAQNNVFVRAALNLPISLTVQPKNNTYTLTQEAPVVLAALKQARRYAIVGREEYLATFGKVTISDLGGVPRFFVGWRDAQLEGVAQNVSVFEDAVMPKLASLVVPGPDAASKMLASAYPKAMSSISEHIDSYVQMIRHVAETRDPRVFHTGEGNYGDNVGEVFILGEDGAGFGDDMAWFLVDAIHPIVDEESETGLNLVYMVKSKQKCLPNLNFEAAITAAGEFYTQDQGAALLMADDFVPSKKVEARAQLISEKAFNTRVMGLDKADRLVEAKTRVSYKFNIGNHAYHGAIATNEIGFADLPKESHFVRPVHNYDVMSVIDEIYNRKFALADFTGKLAASYKDDETLFSDDMAYEMVSPVSAALATFLEQLTVKDVLRFAQTIGAQYRNTVTSLTRIRSMAALSGADRITARGVLQQQQFLALTDLVALELFMATSGLPHKMVQKANDSDQLANTVLSFGSDRAKA